MRSSLFSAVLIMTSTLLYAESLSRAIASSLDGTDVKRPNILLLLSDDHSYPFLSCYDDRNIRTPNIDRLAKEGFASHRFFTACPQCVPSRAALMTGKSPVAARMTRFSSPLPADQITLPEILRDQGGYYTGICGRSYHLDGSVGRGNDVADSILRENNLRTFEKRVHFLKGCGDEAVPGTIQEFLDGRPEDQPFFLWANFSDPHHVWNAPPTWRPNPKELSLPAHWPDIPEMREQFADYCAEVNRLDDTVGKVLAVMEERGLLENTLVVFLGDNGAALPHGKGSLYDPGSNVPFVMCGPGILKASQSRNLLSGEDVAPTLLEAAGLPIPNSMSGVSFWALATGADYQPRRHVFIERGPHGSAPVSVNMASSGYDLGRAVRSDRFKFIYNCTPWLPYSPVDSASGPAWTAMKKQNEEGTLLENWKNAYFTVPRPVYELYDLESDPSELHNLAGKPEFAEFEDQLRRALTEKMILDFDYLPLPEPYSDSSRRTRQQSGRTQGGSEADPARVKRFHELDRDADGKLSPSEFRVNRNPEEALRWFSQRDVNQDGFVDLREYAPRSPLSRP
ncbi:sulfatase-like hydrolase/transferase [Pirellulaceae bacterium SH467]